MQTMEGRLETADDRQQTAEEDEGKIVVMISHPFRDTSCVKLPEQLTEEQIEEYLERITAEQTPEEKQLMRELAMETISRRV